MNTDMQSIAQSDTAKAAHQRRRRVETARNILAVDDDATALLFLETELAELGYGVQTAENGAKALELLRQAPDAVDVIILDRMMPVMDGIAVVRRTKSDPELRHIPIVMLTGADDAEEVSEGVDVGVFYYLAKPLDSSLLESVLNSAMRDAEQKRAFRAELLQQRHGFQLIDTCKFTFRTIDEALDLANFMANCFPDPEQVQPGLAELLINAVEHGNLEIGYGKKAELVRDDGWREEIDRRLDHPDYKDRRAEAVFTHRGQDLCVVVTDQGKGFDWRSFLKIDPSRAADGNGRGIALAVTVSFDKVVFNKAGNQVIGLVSPDSPIDW